jgi:hypothetical protein
LTLCGGGAIPFSKAKVSFANSRIK